CSRVNPRWKLRGIRGDKHLLRRCASRFLPAEIASRPKAMFRAPFADTFFSSAPSYVRQLMTREALGRTPYFNADKVLQYYDAYKNGGGGRRVFVEMGLASVVATQLWHHLFLGGGLCDLPVASFAAPSSVQTN